MSSEDKVALTVIVIALAAIAAAWAVKSYEHNINNDNWYKCMKLYSHQECGVRP